VPATVTSPAEGDRPPEVILHDPAVVALNRQAAVIENVYYSSMTLASLGLDENATVTAMRLVLARFKEAAGNPSDPVERQLLDQLATGHLKVAELFARSEETTNIGFKALYLSAATKLLATLGQLVSTLSGYRSSHSARRGRAPRARRTRRKSERPTDNQDGGGGS
jgi:hypothetical protein